MMASSSSSSNFTDHLLQDDHPWPLFAPSLHHTIGANHQQWSHPLLITDHFTSDEVEALLSAQGVHFHSQCAAQNPQLNLSSLLTMQELGFQWSNCANIADASMALAMLVSQQQLQADGHGGRMISIKPEDDDEIPAENPRSDASSSSCGGGAAIASYRDGADLPLAAIDGVVLPSVNISLLQKPCPAAAAHLSGDGDALEMLASARLCKALLSEAVASSVLHNGIGMPLLRREEQHQHVPYGPRPARLQGPSSILNCNYSYKQQLQMEEDGEAGEEERERPSPSSKKPRLHTVSTNMNIVVPSFKVRKEKLGDRIAALQQLVSPFGKTDTASVLMEAIGYIKFLQDQVETLSGPYMRSSKNKKPRATHQQRPSSANEAGEEEAAKPKADLRSRGLCLVPLSCTSYVTNENGVWAPPPNFRGN